MVFSLCIKWEAEGIFTHYSRYLLTLWSAIKRLCLLDIPWNRLLVYFDYIWGGGSLIRCWKIGYRTTALHIGKTVSLEGFQRDGIIQLNFCEVLQHLKPRVRNPNFALLVLTHMIVGSLSLRKRFPTNDGIFGIAVKEYVGSSCSLGGYLNGGCHDDDVTSDEIKLSDKDEGRCAAVHSQYGSLKQSRALISCSAFHIPHSMLQIPNSCATLTFPTFHINWTSHISRLLN